MKMSDLQNDSNNYVIDSTGWIEYFSNGKCAEKFSKYIEKTGEVVFYTPSLVIFEVYKKINSVYGEDEAIKSIVHMQALTIVVDLDSALSIKAAEISLKERLSLADSIIYATAIQKDATIVTSDRHFSGKAHVIFIE